MPSQLQRSKLSTRTRSLSKGRTNQFPVWTYDCECVVDENSPPKRMQAAPWQLVLSDFGFLTMNAGLIPFMLLPFRNISWDVRPRDVFNQVVLLVVSLVLTALCLAGFVIGFPAPWVASIAVIVYVKTCDYLQGPPTRTSDAGVEIPAGTENEAWFCVNGIATTGGGAQLIANRLETLFHRKITAVLNRSLGLWFDLIECVLQRDLLLITSDVRLGYGFIRDAVRNPNIKRVVIIAHSQGGIIASGWADQLLCDFPQEILIRVEVYTFASAADHFARPTQAGLDFPFAERRIPFGAVEHFANECDFVSRFGVLSNAPTPPDGAGLDGHVPRLTGTFGGRIFERKNHTGHLLNEHYLAPEDNILDDPHVRRFSHLVKYLDGGGLVSSKDK